MKSEIIRFPQTDSLVMACHITGVYDVNRNMTLEGDNFELVRKWAESITALNLKGVIFHNNFTRETCLKYESDSLFFIPVDYDPLFNPNVYRYFVYRDFLQKHSHLLKNIFITDITDVVLVKNPFTDPFFTENPEAIFCGDEPKILNNDWMNAHSAHFRKKIPDYAEYENKYGNETLLNCGIIGGSFRVFCNFIQKLCALHQQFNHDNQTQYTGDMGAFNYLARTQFNDQLKHGPPVNTVFKHYENDRSDCWFIHK